MTDKDKTHGGKRSGAGRQSYFGETTKVMRIPASQITIIKDYLQIIADESDKTLLGDIRFLPKSNTPSCLSLPLYADTIAAGFPSPAEDYIDHPLDLHDYFIKHPASTFYARAVGDSMNLAGIFKDSILAIDKSLEARNGNLVIAVINNEFTVKRFYSRAGIMELRPESDNPSYKPIRFETDNTDIIMWGVVVGVFNKTY
jgi:DNA polymerase V